MAAPGNNRPVLLTRIDTEFPAFPSGQEGTIYVNCHVEALPCAESERKPIDLIAVLDRSGSMSGEKLTLCKLTMEFLMQQLTNKDRLGLVTYDDHVKTDFPLTKMDALGKEELLRVVKAVHDGGSTNLSGGLMQGIQEIQNKTRKDKEAPNPVRSLLLLTDGLANVGITTTPEIVNIVKGSLAENVSVFCFGYGKDHNADLLRQISDVGRAAYYFVEKIDGISLAFADCLGGLLSVVAQNIKVDCVAQGNVEIVEIVTKRTIHTIEPRSHMQVEIGDMYAEEHRDLLMSLKVPPLQAGAPSTIQNLVEFRLSFANVLGGRLEEVVATATIDRPPTVPTLNANSMVVYQKNRTNAAAAMERAQKEADAGRLDQGKQVLEDVATSLQSDLNKLNSDDSERAKALLVDLRDLQEGMKSRNSYESYGHHKMNTRAQKHWAQRKNSVSDEDEEAESGSSEKQIRAAYSNCSKVELKKKAKAFFKR